MSISELILTRRAALLALLSLGLAATQTAPAFAKDGESGGGDGGGDSDGGDSDGGGDNDGGGDDKDDSDNDRDDDHDDDSDDDRDDDSNDKKDQDRDKIRNAVRSGDAASLKDILAVVRRKHKGEIVRIRLTGRGTNLMYRIRLIDTKRRLIEVRVSAKTRRIIDAKGL